MSRFHYIGASQELPIGERGSIKSPEDCSGTKPTKALRLKSASLPEGTVPLEQIIDLSHIQADETEVYETMADAAGIYINELGAWNDAIRKHFKHPYVYQLSPNFGSFSLNTYMEERFPEEYKAHVKCINELFRLIREYGRADEPVEIYTCWSGEESHEPNYDLNLVIDLLSFELKEGFELKEKQYIQVKI